MAVIGANPDARLLLGVGAGSSSLGRGTLAYAAWQRYVQQTSLAVTQAVATSGGSTLSHVDAGARPRTRATDLFGRTAVFHPAVSTQNQRPTAMVTWVGNRLGLLHKQLSTGEKALPTTGSLARRAAVADLIRRQTRVASGEAGHAVRLVPVALSNITLASARTTAGAPNSDLDAQAWLGAVGARGSLALGLSGQPRGQVVSTPTLPIPGVNQAVPASFPKVVGLWEGVAQTGAWLPALPRSVGQLGGRLQRGDGITALGGDAQRWGLADLITNNAASAAEFQTLTTCLSAGARTATQSEAPIAHTQLTTAAGL